METTELKKTEPVKMQTAELATPAKLVMRKFVRAATIRAVKTMAQTAASLMGAKALISDVDWKALVSATLMSGILSILTSVYSGLPEVETELPSGNVPQLSGGKQEDEEK